MDDNKVFIVADVGVNHSGDTAKAKSLMHCAIKHGANAVKFQYWSKCKFPEIEHLRLNKDQMRSVKYYYDLFEKSNCEFMCTAFDLDAFRFVDEELDCQILKIPNNKTVYNDGLLINGIIGSAIHKNKKLFISNNFNLRYSLYFHENKDLKRIYEDYMENARYLHCVSEYPAKLNENLNCFVDRDLSGFYKHGFSDHSGFPEIPVAAVALGAKIIEVHITDDRNQEGPDHKASLNIRDFSLMVKMIRNVEMVI